METFDELYKDIKDFKALAEPTDVGIAKILTPDLSKIEEPQEYRAFEATADMELPIILDTPTIKKANTSETTKSIQEIENSINETTDQPLSKFRENMSDYLNLDILTKIRTQIAGRDLTFNPNVLSTTKIEDGKMKGLAWSGFSTQDVRKVESPLTLNTFDDNPKINTPVTKMLLAKADFWSNLAYPHFLITYDKNMEGSSSLYDSISEDKKSDKLSMQTLDVPMRIKNIAYDTEELGVNYYNTPTRSVPFTTGKSKMSGESSFSVTLDNQMHLLSWIYSIVGDYRFGGSFFSETKNNVYKGGGLAQNVGDSFTLSLVVNILGQNTDTLSSKPEALDNPVDETKGFIVYEDIRLLGSDSSLVFGNNKPNTLDIDVGFTYAYKYVFNQVTKEL